MFLIPFEWMLCFVITSWRLYMVGIEGLKELRTKLIFFRPGISTKKVLN